MGPKKPSLSKGKPKEEDKGEMPEDAREDGELAKAGPSAGNTPSRTRTQRSAALRASEKISSMKKSTRASTSLRPTPPPWSTGEQISQLTENVGDKDGKSADNTRRSTRASTSLRPTLPPWSSRAEMEARRMTLLAKSSTSAADSKEILLKDPQQAQNIKEKKVLSTGEQISELTEKVGDKDGKPAYNKRRSTRKQISELTKNVRNEDGKSADNARRNSRSSEGYPSSGEIAPFTDIDASSTKCIFNTSRDSHKGERAHISNEPDEGDAPEGCEPDEGDAPEGCDPEGYEPDESDDLSDSSSQNNSDDWNSPPSLIDPGIHYLGRRPAKITARRITIADENVVSPFVKWNRYDIYTTSGSSITESEEEDHIYPSRRSRSGDREKGSHS